MQVVVVVLQILQKICISWHIYREILERMNSARIREEGVLHSVGMLEKLLVIGIESLYLLM